MKKFKRADIKKIGTERTITIPVKRLRLLEGEIISDIINRTLRGKDKNNKSFKPYSRDYAEYKKKKFGVSKPNLNVTTNMLNSINGKNILNGLKFYINTNSEKQKALANINRGRDFMGIDSMMKKDIEKRIFK